MHCVQARGSAPRRDPPRFRWPTGRARRRPRRNAHPAMPTPAPPRPESAGPARPGTGGGGAQFGHARPRSPPGPQAARPARRAPAVTRSGAGVPGTDAGRAAATAFPGRCGQRPGGLEVPAGRLGWSALSRCRPVGRTRSARTRRARLFDAGVAISAESWIICHRVGGLGCPHLFGGKTRSRQIGKRNQRVGLMPGASSISEK